MKNKMNILILKLFILTLFFSINSYSNLKITDKVKLAQSQYVNLNELIAYFQKMEKADPTKLMGLFDLPSDVGVTAPNSLYHYLTKNSLQQWNARRTSKVNFPLKKVGTDEYQSLLVKRAPVYKNVDGLYGWTNPIGAYTGGSGEIYGNGEALLVMQLRRENVKIGVLITASDNNGEPIQMDLDPTVTNKYDLLIHINTMSWKKEFLINYTEWVLLNPQIVLAYTTDLDFIIPQLRRMQSDLKLMEKAGSTEPLVDLAGIPHAPQLRLTTSTDVESIIRRIINANPENQRPHVQNKWTLTNEGQKYFPNQCKIIFK